MRKRLMTVIIGISMLGVTAFPISASPIELIYDGEKHLYELAPITLYIDGEKIDTDLMPPIQIEGVTLVPVREIFSPLGSFIEWKAEEKKVYIDCEDKLVILEMNQKEAWINGEIIPLDVPAKVINNKIMVPLRFIGEEMGLGLQWIGESREIHIKRPLKEETNPEKSQEGEIPSDNPSQETEEVESVVRYDWKQIEYLDYSETDRLLSINIPEIQIEKVDIKDLYRERKIHIELEGNFEDFLESGKWFIGEKLINEIEVVNGKRTSITLQMNSVYVPQLVKTLGGIGIELKKPKEVYNQIIVIDPGHGGYAPGTIVEDLVEKEINLKQALAIREMIENNSDVKVYMTREDDLSVENKNRPLLANEIEADFFISIHNNYAEKQEAKGSEVFYYPHAEDKRSEEIAKILQSKVVLYGGTKDRGTKAGKDLIVLNSSHMPAVLIEGGFLSNPEDRKSLISEDFTQKFAYGIYEGVVEIFNTLSFR